MRGALGATALAIGSLLLVQVAPRFPGHILLWSLACLALAAAALLIPARAARLVERWFAPAFCIFALIAVLAPPYVSDDVLRHYSDGVRLLADDNPYATAPENARIVAPEGYRPNHSEFGTIYLPVTQSQALGAAWLARTLPFASYALHARLFDGIYLLIVLGGVLGARAMLGPGGRRVWSALWFSPALAFALAGRHADVQGLALLVPAALLTLRGCAPDDPAPNALRSDRSPPRRFAAVFAAGGGFVAALLPGLKPEGGLWLGALGGLALLAAIGFPVRLRRIVPGLARASSDRTPSTGALRFSGLAAWGAGALAGLGWQFWFARAWLWPDGESWDAFLETAQIFADWFLAYNPVLDAQLALYGENRPELFRFWRRLALAGGLLAALIWPSLRLARLLQRQGRRDPIERAAAIARLRRGTPWIFASGAFLIGLCAWSAAKGAWHPWYFLWLAPALYWCGLRRLARIGTGALPLWYLPVVQIRAGGQWNMDGFYPLVAGCFLVAIFLTNVRSNRSLKIWRREYRRNGRKSTSS